MDGNDSRLVAYEAITVSQAQQEIALVPSC